LQTGTEEPSPGTDGAQPGLDNLRLRFNERLQQLGLSLSNRETEVCIGLLAGRTAPELAEQLQLKVNTVESYLKRADQTGDQRPAFVDALDVLAGGHVLRHQRGLSPPLKKNRRPHRVAVLHWRLNPSA
jgi:DNA-binding CsgD family transcriptional regulator